ncbi:MAG: leucine-rich repeat domain-containing protein [Alphaproteobacteria bacterium]|nr:leucine-rich repeat domain-containing protein [Alphaproteobacteria bacterium]
MKKYILILEFTMTIVLSTDVFGANCPLGTTEGVDCFNCGNDCKAYLSDDTVNNGKTLNIIGNGNMDDFACDQGVWAPWPVSQITSAVIQGKNENGSGITSIGAWTFMLATNLKSVSIPDSVTSIKGSAFKGTSTLTNLDIPNSVTSIGNEAFYSAGLESITIPEGITSIEQGMFNNTYSLENIILPDSITKIGEYAFKETNLQNLVIPETVTEIGKKAFTEIPGVVWCSSALCEDKGSDNVQIYTIDKSGAYKAGDDYFATFADFSNNVKCEGGLDTACITKALENKALKLKKQNNICFNDEECMALVNAEYYDGVITKGTRNYASINDLINGNHIKKRIYTIDEANAVTKPTGNTVRIKYR